MHFPLSLHFRTPLRCHHITHASQLTHDTETAVHMYERLSETHRTYTHSLLRLGAISQERRQFREASDWYTQAAALAPHDATSWALLGNLQFSRRDWGQAQAKFEKILADKEGGHSDVRWCGCDLVCVGR